MRALIALVGFLLLTGAAHGQQAKTRLCYQYLDADSSQLALVSRTTYDAAGHLQQKVILKNSWATPSSYDPAGNVTTYCYRDTLQFKETTVFGRNKEQDQRLYYYDAAGHLLRQVGFRWEHKIKPRHRYRPDGTPRHVFGKNDIQRRLTKTKIAEIFYTYDPLGRRTSSTAPILSYSTENKYQWTYDSLSRLTQEKVYGDDKLLYETVYRYQQNGFSNTRIWYERSGEKSSARTLSWKYIPEYTTLHKTDEQGRIVEELTTTEKGAAAGHKTISYNRAGEIARIVMSEPGRNTVTQIFRYE